MGYSLLTACDTYKYLCLLDAIPYECIDKHNHTTFIVGNFYL